MKFNMTMYGIPKLQTQHTYATQSITLGIIEKQSHIINIMEKQSHCPLDRDLSSG